MSDYELESENLEESFSKEAKEAEEQAKSAPQEAKEASTESKKTKKTSPKKKTKTTKPTKKLTSSKKRSTNEVEEFIKRNKNLNLTKMIAVFAREFKVPRLLSSEVGRISPNKDPYRILSFMYAKR